MAMVMTFRENGQATVVELPATSTVPFHSAPRTRPVSSPSSSRVAGSRWTSRSSAACPLSGCVCSFFCSARPGPWGRFPSSASVGSWLTSPRRRALWTWLKGQARIPCRPGPGSCGPHRHLPDAPACRVRPPVRPPVPPGAWPVPGGVNFLVFSRHATPARWCCSSRGGPADGRDPLPGGVPRRQRLRMTVFGLSPERRVRLPHGRAVGRPAGHRFDRSKVLLDPYAACVAGRDVWGERASWDRLVPYRAALVPDDFDWEGDRPLGLPIEDLVIYEMHVRGFTRNPSSGVQVPRHLRRHPREDPLPQGAGRQLRRADADLRVRRVRERSGRHPRTGERCFNYWGYSTLASSPRRRAIAATDGPACRSTSSRRSSRSCTGTASR